MGKETGGPGSLPSRRRKSIASFAGKQEENALLSTINMNIAEPGSDDACCSPERYAKRRASKEEYPDVEIKLSLPAAAVWGSLAQFHQTEQPMLTHAMDEEHSCDLTRGSNRPVTPTHTNPSYVSTARHCGMGVECNLQRTPTGPTTHIEDIEAAATAAYVAMAKKNLRRHSEPNLPRMRSSIQSSAGAKFTANRATTPSTRSSRRFSEPAIPSVDVAPKLAGYIPSFRSFFRWVTPPASFKTKQKQQESEAPTLSLSGRARLGSVVDASTSTFDLLLVIPYRVPS
jgi:hypothetical protein